LTYWGARASLRMEVVRMTRYIRSLMGEKEAELTYKLGNTPIPAPGWGYVVLREEDSGEYDYMYVSRGTEVRPAEGWVVVADIFPAYDESWPEAYGPDERRAWQGFVVEALTQAGILPEEADPHPADFFPKWWD